MIQCLVEKRRIDRTPGEPDPRELAACLARAAIENLGGVHGRSQSGCVTPALRQWALLIPKTTVPPFARYAQEDKVNSRMENVKHRGNNRQWRRIKQIFGIYALDCILGCDRKKFGLAGCAGGLPDDQNAVRLNPAGKRCVGEVGVASAPLCQVSSMVTVLYRLRWLCGSVLHQVSDKQERIFLGFAGCKHPFAADKAKASVAVREGREFRVSKATQERASMPFSRKATAACRILSCNWP